MRAENMDFSGTASEPITREFLAVVLAGFGDELSPLTGDHGDTPSPKALLPILNKPMLDYPLSWIEQSGVRDVLLICPASHRPAIAHHINSDSTSASFSSLRIDLQAFDESQDIGGGTCSVLRHFSGRIQEDFILIPCDVFPPASFPLTTLLNKFRTEAVSDGSIVTSLWYGAPSEKDTSPEEWGMLPSPFPIVWDEPSGTLLHVDTPEDVDKDSEDLNISMALLNKYPRTRLTANLHDAHVYVCRRSVLNALNEKSFFSSFREEFIPWLCKVQYQRTRREKYGHFLSPITNQFTQSMSLRHSSLFVDKLRPVHGKGGYASPPTHGRDLTLSAPPSPMGFDEETEIPPSLRIGLMIHPTKDGYMTRLNNLHAYLQTSRHLLSQRTYSLPTDPDNRALIDQKAQISPDSEVGDSTKIGERTTIKRSVIGKHCVIGKMARIVGCVLLDHCEVGDGAKVEGSLLGRNTNVGAKAELIKCATQAGYEIAAGETYKNEKLDVADWTTGPMGSESDEGTNTENNEDSDDDVTTSGESE